MRSLGTRMMGSACLALALAGGSVASGVLPDGLKIERILAGASDVGDLSQSPTGELWVLEKTSGRIRIYDSGVETRTLTMPVDPSCSVALLDVAFPPDYGSSRRALVAYRHTSGALRVDEVVQVAGTLVQGAAIVDIDGGGDGAGFGCRSGGALAVDPGGKLFLGVGDLGDPASAQDSLALTGKVLRLNIDGSIPANNPDPSSPVFAGGFRDVADLAINPDTARPGGTLYVADAGEAGEAADEINVVGAGGNYGWNIVSGNSRGSFGDPLVDFGVGLDPGNGLEALVTLRDDRLGGDGTGSLIYARRGADRLEQAFISGAENETLSETRVFFDADGDSDGTPDTGCPRAIDALFVAGDGMLYAASGDTDPGIWRVYRDHPGPREVSPPGSPFPLRIDKQGPSLVLGWEHLGALDSGRPPRHGGQHAETYQVWEGSLSLAPSGYDHAVILATDGSGETGPARRTATIAPGAGDRYYLVTAQGDNLEGSAGVASDGTTREPSTTDYCPNLGIGRFTGDCIDDFRNPNSGQPMKLIDYNPLSATYMQPLSIRDFRGTVVHLDISADNCPFCNLQAPTYREIDLDYRARDFMLLTILNASLSGPVPFASPAECAERIADWSIRHDEHTPVLCDVDLNGDDLGDVSRQYFHIATGTEPCGGTPQNLFIDSGGTIYAFECSYTPGPEVSALIAPEVNPDECE